MFPGHIDWTLNQRMPASDEICCVVITYNPDSCALECLSNVLIRAKHTVVVDNGSTPESLAQLHDVCVAKAVTLVENDANLGVGAGLNIGINTALSIGYRWFLLLDQDTFLLPDTISDMAEIYGQFVAGSGTQVVLLGANFFHQNADGSVLPARVSYAPGRSWVEVNCLITSGTLISQAAFENIGPFREDFFIDSIDHEYCFRAGKRKIPCIQSVQPLMLHRIGMVVSRRVWHRFGRTVQLACYSPLRRYYQVRNFMVMGREYGKDFPIVMVSLRAQMMKDLKRAVLYQGCAWRLIKAVVKGVLDARQGRLGKHTADL